MMSGYIQTLGTAEQSFDRLQAIIASAMDALITIDDTHRIICFNPAAERMFKIPASEALGQPLENFIPHRFRDGHDDHIRRFGTTGETSRRMGALGAISALRANGEEFPVEASISQANSGGERLSTVIMRDITEREANAKAQALLAREVDHRAKNILAIVSSLVSLTKAPTPEAYVQSLSGRIAAMSRAHGLLARQRWTGADLATLARDELEAHAEPARFHCAGPGLVLSSRAVQPLSMLVHELATNAVKYGSLSVPEGRVELSWTPLPKGGIALHWRERGGPEIILPVEQGFGSTLIQQIIESQLGGDFKSAWSPEGFELFVQLPETVLQAPGDQRPSSQDAGSGQSAPARRDRAGDAEQGGTLLIVEDEPLLAMQLRNSLEECGWSVIGVAGSIENANQILSGTTRPDAAILDVDLGGVPVFPLARALRRSGIPFLFCTGYEDLDYSPEFAHCATVRKPATALQVVRALRQVVHDAATSAGT